MDKIADFMGTGVVVLPTVMGLGADDLDSAFISVWVMLALFLATLFVRARPEGLPPEE